MHSAAAERLLLPRGLENGRQECRRAPRELSPGSSAQFLLKDRRRPHYLDSFSIRRRCFVNTLSATAFPSSSVAYRRRHGETISFFPSILSSTSASLSQFNISRTVWGSIIPFELPIWDNFLTRAAISSLYLHRLH